MIKTGLKFGILIILSLSLIVLVSYNIGSFPKLPQFEPFNNQNLERLSLEQKVGQLFMVGFEGTKMTPSLKKVIQEIHPGGILLLRRNIESQDQLRRLIQDLQEVAREDTGPPLLVAVDQEGEPMCRIPFVSCTSPKEIETKEQAFQVGLNRGQELKELGVNLNLAPALDQSSSSDFIFPRVFKEELAPSFIKGQSEAGILNAIKHFPGYGGISFNPENEKLAVLNLPEVSQFQKALKADPAMVMVSNVVYPELDEQLPFSLSPLGIDFLKEKLDKEVLIVSDDLSSLVLKKEFGLEKTIVLAKKAGIDILIVAGFWEISDVEKSFNFLLEAVKNNKVSKEKINESVLKIIRLKQRL